MMRRFIIFIIVITASVAIHPQESRPIPFVVSTSWLAEHVNDPDLVVLHAGWSRNDYQFGHIPGSRFLWFLWLAPSNPDRSTEMPSVEQAEPVLEELGITIKSRIVVYSNGNIPPTARMLLALSYFGFKEQVAFLDGGLEAWKAEGRTIEQGIAKVKRSKLKIKPDHSVITDAKWIKANLDSPDVTLTDARARIFYEGEGGGTARTGHIKGAVSIPYASLVDATNRLKPVDSLRVQFSQFVKPGSKVVTYCHVGQQASFTYLVARLLGYDAAVYDGSFEEWNFLGEEYPVEKPVKKQ